MRYILILLLFISGAASAQFAPTSAKTKFSNGIAIGSKDTSAFSAADTMVLTIARDSVMYYKYRGVWRPIATGGNLNNYKLISDTLFNNGYTTRARTKQYGDSIAALKLNISDTASMLANRLKISDTASMLLPFVQYSDTAAIVAGYVLNNRFLDSLTNVQTRIQTKQPLGAYITLADSTTILAGRWLPNRSADSIAVIRALANTKLNISDTASMLSPYYRTATATAALALKLNISDTATMLTPFVQYSDTANQMSGYLRKSFALLLQDTASALSNRLKISDTLTMLAPYARTANLPSLTPYLLKADSLSGGYTSWLLTKKKVDSLGAVISAADLLKKNANDSFFVSGFTTRGRTKQGLDSLGVLKLNISDTAAMLANRLKISDTLTMLSKLSLDRVLINGNTSGRGVVLGTGSFTSSGSSNTVEIAHSSGSGIALNITKGGNGEGLYVNKTSGSGNAATIIGTLNATTLVKSGGTSSQYLMADGSTSTLTNPVTGTGTTNYLPKFTGTSTIGNSLIFDDGSNVGINTATPGALLDISSGTTNEILRFGASSRWGFYRTNNDNRYVAFVRTANATATPVWTVDGDNGNVGIGTTSPGAKFHVAAGYGLLNNAYSWAIYNTSSNGFAAQFGAADDVAFANTGNNAIISAAGSNAILFGTNSAERMRISSGGNVLIKTTTDNGTDALQVAGSGLFTGVTSAMTLATSTADDNVQLRFKGGITGNTWAIGNNISAGGTGVNFDIFNLNTSTNALRIASTGSATFSGAVTGASFSVSNGSVSNNGFWGMLNTAGTGSFADWALVNSSSSGIMYNPTGTLNMVFAGSINGTSAAFSGGVNMATSSGNVGIGTITPGETFTVNGSIGLQRSGTQYWHTAVNASNGLEFVRSGIATRLTITSDGNTLIKTTTDNGTDALQVAGSVYSSGILNIGKSQSGNAALTVKSPAGGNTGIILIEGDRPNDGWGLYSVTSDNFIITRFTDGSFSDLFTMTPTGAATFSSTVSATHYTGSTASYGTTATMSADITTAFCSGSGYTFTLPSASGVTGKIITVIYKGNLTGITLSGASVSGYTLTCYASVILVSNGTNWDIAGEFQNSVPCS
jgi:hypothetical protein